MAKIWERFATGDEAERAREADGAIMSVTWAVLAWLYMDDIPGESRLEFLRRAERIRILKGSGYREIERLERQANKAK